MAENCIGRSWPCIALQAQCMLQDERSISEKYKFPRNNRKLMEISGNIQISDVPKAFGKGMTFKELQAVLDSRLCLKKRIRPICLKCRTPFFLTVVHPVGF